MEGKKSRQRDERRKQKFIPNILPVQMQQIFTYRSYVWETKMKQTPYHHKNSYVQLPCHGLFIISMDTTSYQICFVFTGFTNAIFNITTRRLTAMAG